MQLTHQNTHFSTVKFEIILLCDGVNSPANMGSLLRVADSFGVQKVIFGKVSVDLQSPRLKRTARATQNWVSIAHEIDSLGALKQYESKGYTPVALEITNKSRPIQQINFLYLKKVLLIIGDESIGISKPVLELCKLQAHITMFGKNSSMNVSQAASIALYEITKQLNE